MKKFLAFSALLAVFSGCKNVQVETVKPWEGRYSTVEEMREKTSGMKLEDGESVWVITNHTLYRVLKKAEK